MKTILKIGAKELETVCEKVNPILDTNYKEIITELKDTLKGKYFRPAGYGLASNQIGYNKCCIAICPTLISKEIKILINPKIVNHGRQIVEDNERCMSQPGVTAKINRYRVINVEYSDEKWTPHIETFKGLPARIIQHELAHLNGLNCLENRLETE